MPVVGAVVLTVKGVVVVGVAVNDTVGSTVAVVKGPVTAVVDIVGTPVTFNVVPVVSVLQRYQDPES